VTGQVWEAHSALQHSCLQSTQPISGEETATWDGCYGTRTQQVDVASPDWQPVLTLQETAASAA